MLPRILSLRNHFWCMLKASLGGGDLPLGGGYPRAPPPLYETLYSMLWHGKPVQGLVGYLAKLGGQPMLSPQCIIDHSPAKVAPYDPEGKPLREMGGCLAGV